MQRDELSPELAEALALDDRARAIRSAALQDEEFMRGLRQAMEDEAAGQPMPTTEEIIRKYGIDV